MLTQLTKGGGGGWSNVGAKMLITNIPLVPNVNNQSKGPEWSVFYKGWQGCLKGFRFNLKKKFVF